MPIVNSAVEINASVETVWQIITDFARMSEWNPVFTHITGEFKVGSAIAITGAQGLLHATILEIQPYRKVVWSGKSLQPTVRFTRTQTVEEIGPGRVRYANREELTGLLATLFSPLSEKALREMFEKINAATKSRAESAR